MVLSVGFTDKGVVHKKNVKRMETKWVIIFFVSILISVISLILFIVYDFPFLLLFLFLPFVFGVRNFTKEEQEFPRVFCRRCGSRLPPDSIYCPKCGIIID